MVRAESLANQMEKQMKQDKPPIRHEAGQKAPHRAAKGPQTQVVNHPIHRWRAAPVAHLGVLAAFPTLEQDFRNPEQGQRGLEDQRGQQEQRRDLPALRKERPELRLGRLPADRLEPLREPPLGQPPDRWLVRQELRQERQRVWSCQGYSRWLSALR